MLTLCGIGRASSLQISPVMIELRHSEGAAILTLRNPGDQSLYGQVRVFRWEQGGSQDNLSATQELVASPPLIEIPAHGEQYVRLVRSEQGNPIEEQSYRLLIDELPAADNAGENGVTIRLRYSVPVFVEPEGMTGAPTLSWHVRHGADGWWLRVTNTGRRRARISMVQFIAADGKASTVDKGLLGYALAGRSMQWRVNLDSQGALKTPIVIRANVNALAVEDHAVIDTSP
ncbi:molecular chaperone [Dyella choica]|uniref:Molecular chaperone n=2 Tax=Dyella choica TaxID=1927959 RepID=A0A3S0RLZ2_9GAMM|nr:molecular chaperone [Dyella choica]